jgi:hypothetical protein
MRGRGLYPSEKVPGWLEFFSVAAVQAELLLGLTISPGPSHIACSIRPFLESVGGREHGEGIVVAGVESLLSRSKLAQRIVQEILA